jgi:spore maturation protein CgeB
MRIVQIASFYPAYAERFYAERPGLEARPYKEQLQTFLSDGFTAAHLFAPELRRAGCDAHLFIFNCEQLQRAWAREHGHVPQGAWWYDIALQQVNQLRPDILYFSEPIALDSRFVRALQHRPHVVAGWRAAHIPAWVDFTEFDVILSNAPQTAALAKKHGARSTHYFLPGFPEWIADAVQGEAKVHDLVFCGQLTPDHQRRIDLVERLASHATRSREFLPAFFVGNASQEVLSSARPYTHEALWGMDFYRELKRGKIGFNNVIDFAKGEAGNMRQFEVTGSGTMLLTEYNSNLSQHFEVGREIETYSSFEELIEKLRYYLSHDVEREAMAQRGQERCLRDHGMIRRTKELVDILSQYVGSSITVKQPEQRPQLSELVQKIVVLLNAEQVEDSYHVTLQALRLYPEERNVNYLRAVALLKMQRFVEAREALARETALYPDHAEAASLNRILHEAALQGRPQH